MKKNKLDTVLIKAVYNAFRNQRRILNDFNNKLSTAHDEDEWIALFRKRAETTKVAFGLNNETGSLISDILFSENKLSYDYAEVFYHEDIATSADGELDIFFSSRALTRLSDYYRKSHDLLRLITILEMLGNRYLATVKFYFENNYIKALNCFKEILSYKASYSLIPDLNLRKIFFTSYYNLCCFLPLIESPDTITASESLDYLLEALSFYNSDTVQKLDGQSPEIRQCIDRIKENWLYIEYRIDSADSETKSAFINLAHNVYNESMKQMGNDIYKIPISTLLSYQHALILEGSTSYIDAVNYMMEYYHNRHVMYNRTDHGTELNLDEFYFETRLPIALIKWLDKIDILSDMCSKLKKHLLDSVNSYYIGLSEKKIFSHVIYESVCEWCFFAVKYFETPKEKETFLLDMLINREPQTFFNAHLNEDLAELITRSLYASTPVLLNSVENYLKTNGFPNTKEDVIDYIKKCALFHDIGMNLMSRLEGIQFRTLTKEEKDVLQRHTTYGSEFFKNGLDIYYEPVLGHHKYYDQSEGYPLDLDLSNSPVRIVCDILAICDALNSGTDYIGRVYKESKDFSIILSELITLSGTRYNTNLVNLFLDDIDLSFRVDSLISKDREKTYYNYYKKYFDKKSKI